MKSMRFSHVSLMAGLILGLTALWVGASPIGVAGDLVSGGWSTCTDQYGNTVAATLGNWTCPPCQGVLTRYCYEYNGGNCTGGSITVAITTTGQPGLTVHSAGYIPCSGSCFNIYAGDCY